MRVRLEFKPQDLWVGAFWKTNDDMTDIWICLVPCFPLHITLKEPTADDAHAPKQGEFR